MIAGLDNLRMVIANLNATFAEIARRFKAAVADLFRVDDAPSREVMAWARRCGYRHFRRCLRLDRRGTLADIVRATVRPESSISQSTRRNRARYEVARLRRLDRALASHAAR